MITNKFPILIILYLCCHVVYSKFLSFSSAQLQLLPVGYHLLFDQIKFSLELFRSQLIFCTLTVNV